MNLQELRVLVDYHYWARDRLLAAVEGLTPEQFLRDLGGSFSSIRDTLAHVYSAELVWLARWQGEAPAAMISAETFPDLTTFSEAWTQLESQMRTFLEGLRGDDAERVIAYKTFAGLACTSPLWQMIQHVVNHASYHRGQVTTLLRQLGVAPPKTMDLINFYRERGT